MNISVYTSTPEYVSIANISSTTHLHNYGLAMFACISPLQNMRPPQYIEAVWKEVFKKWFSPQISSKPLSPQETELKKW
jgi:hypothetical protein